MMFAQTSVRRKLESFTLGFKENIRNLLRPHLHFSFPLAIKFQCQCTVKVQMIGNMVVVHLVSSTWFCPEAI